MGFARYDNDVVYVPDGSVIAGIATISSASSTYVGANFASLGLTLGSYTVAWNTDSITVNVVSSAAVPEPGTAAIGLLIGGAAMFRRSRKRRA